MNLLAKEKILYEILASKTNDKDFIVCFHDYFSFIIEEGLELCVHLSEPMSERNGSKVRIHNLYKEIIVSVEDFIKNIEKFLKKENLEDDFIFQDRLHDTKSLIEGTSYVFNGERLDSIYSEMSDMTRRLRELGFEKELSKYVNKDRHSKLNTDDIIALEKRKLFITEKNNFNKKDIRSLAGVFVRLSNLYAEINKAESSTESRIDMETFLEDLEERNRNEEYTKLMSGKMKVGSFFNRDKYVSDIERFHQSIVVNNTEIVAEENKTGDIFLLKGNDIYHYGVGRLHYDKNGLKEPKYIQMFKNVITYMPDQKDKVRISELEKNISKKDQCGKNYRVNLGKSAKPFNNFLNKNGVKNIHPEKKIPIISVTDEYITFYNKI